MRVVVLGPMGVVDAPTTAPSGEIARRVLAVLVAEANRPVHPDRLADLVWPGGRRAGGNSLQAHISRWRKALGGHRITYSPAGYTLVLGPDELDALEFEELARAATAARSEGDRTTALELCRQALRLWRGPAFADLPDADCVRGRRVELETARAAVRLTRLEMLCSAGRYDDVVPEATTLVAAEPWNEPAHRVLARALYGLGDQVTALQVLADLESELRNELGLDLGTSAQLLREQILRHEPALDLAPDRPSTISAAPVTRLADRVTGLDRRTQRILHAAALAGTDVDTAHIGRVLAIDGPTMASALAPALATGILVRTDEGIRFAGAGVHEAVAELVPADEALRLHRRLGEALLSGGGAEWTRRAADHLAAAAPVDARTAQRAVELDQQLARESLSRAQYDDAVRRARRAIASAAHVAQDDARGPDQADLHLTLGAALQRSGDLGAAMSAYAAAARDPGVEPEVLLRSALAHEECSLHARRHRTGARDPSIELIEQALTVVDDAHPGHVELLASLAQALTFSGLGDRARRLADTAVTEARRSADPEVLARTLLRALAAHDPVTDAPIRLRLAREAAEVGRAADADELEVEALCAWVPELMRAGQLAAAEEVVSRVAHLADVQGNVLHRCKVPMWRAALALAAGRHDEAEVLIEDFRRAGHRDGYDDTARIHGFQSILLALGRQDPGQAAAILARFDDDRAFEPWLAARLTVAHAAGDPSEVRRLLVPWSARRFTLSRPFAGVQTFCACLVAEAVAECGDAAARSRLAELIAPGQGQHQVLGAGAAMLGDAAHALAVLLDADRDAEQADENDENDLRRSTWTTA